MPSAPPPLDVPVDDLPPGDIRRDTRPQQVDGRPGRFHTVIPDAWRVLYAFGGTTMATAVRAATAAVDRPDLDLVSAEATYCQAVPCGPVAVEVEVVRQGRGGAQAQARLWSLEPGGPDAAAAPVRTDLLVTCVFGRREADSPYRFLGAEPPAVKEPEECAPRERVEDSPFNSIPYHRQTDWRLADGAMSWGRPDVPPGEPRAASWFRFLASPMDDRGMWEPGVVAVPGDVLGPAVGAGIGTQGGHFLVISLQIGMRFVADVGTEWLLQHTRAQVAADGFASGTAELWDADRRLVALAHQIARLQRFPGT